jgi:hypothetical protein
VDDIDARTTETVTFGLDGRNYEIDLPDQEAERLRATLAPYISAARRVRGRSRHTGGRALLKDLARTGGVRH